MYLPHVKAQHLLQALPWLRWLAASLSPQRPRFNPRRVHVVFVMNKMELRQVFHQVPQFSCQCSSTTAPHSFIHSYITNATQSFIHSLYHQQCQQWITSLTNTVKKSMFVEATRSHTHKRTDRKAQETCFAEEYSGQALPVHSHWTALNLRQLPIFQGDKSCVFQQDITQLHNFRSINLLLE